MEAWTTPEHEHIPRDDDPNQEQQKKQRNTANKPSDDRFQKYPFARAQITAV